MNKKQVIIRMDPEDKRLLEKRAEQDGRSMNSYILNLIKQDTQSIRIPVIGTIKDDKIIFEQGE